MSSWYGGSKKADWPAAATAVATRPGPSPPYQAPSTTAGRRRNSWERSASGRTYKVMVRAMATARTAAPYDQTAFDREVGTCGGRMMPGGSLKSNAHAGRFRHGDSRGFGLVCAARTARDGHGWSF